MRNGLQKYLLVLLTVGLCVLPALGQGASTGSLSGTVTDPKGAVVAGATVTVKNAATNQEFSTQTNNNGAYSITALTTGVYTASIVAAGFKQAAVTDIKIDGDRATATVTYHFDKAPDAKTPVPMTFAREGGAWKVCSTGPS